MLSVKDASNQAVRSYTYDAVGNPLSDGVYNYVWSGGRLKEVRGATDNELIASYTYDANGLRSSKTVGNKRCEYYYSDGLLRLQKISNPEIAYAATYLFYSYGESGLEWIEYYKEYDGNVEDNTLYWVEHNPQGMILTLYEYDLYGNYHRFRYGAYWYDAEYNYKFHSPDGHCEVVVCIPDIGDPYFVTDPINCGSYNFGTNWAEHILYDWLPYVIWGNTPTDRETTSLWNRL